MKPQPLVKTELKSFVRKKNLCLSIFVKGKKFVKKNHRMTSFFDNLIDTNQQKS